MESSIRFKGLSSFFFFIVSCLVAGNAREWVVWMGEFRRWSGFGFACWLVVAPCPRRGLGPVV